jgi:hypothetical protein
VKRGKNDAPFWKKDCQIPGLDPGAQRFAADTVGLWFFEHKGELRYFVLSAG